MGLGMITTSGRNDALQGSRSQSAPGKVSESRAPRPDQTWLYGARIVQHLEMMFKPISPVSSAG
jgi:hypothetical protein